MRCSRIAADRSKPHHFSCTVDEEDRKQLFFGTHDPESYHILELDQFENSGDAVYTVNGSGDTRALAPSLFKWLRFLKDGSQEDFMAKYRETDTAIAEAKQEYERFIDDDRMIIAQLRRDRQDHDLAQFKHDAREDGLAEGRAEGKVVGRVEGKAEAQREAAAKLKQLGVAVFIIIQATGLSAEEIAAL